MSGPDREARPPALLGWSLAIGGSLAMAASYVDRATLAAISPTVTHALVIGDRGYGWLSAAFSVSYLIASPLAGRLCDRFGPRRVLPIAIAVWSMIAAGHALATGIVSLFALRIALGVAEAPSAPAAALAIRRALPREHRAAAFGLMFTGSSVGSSIAPLIAIRLATAHGWPSAFLGTAAAGACWVPLWLLASWPRAAREALDAPPPAPAGPAEPAWRLARDPELLRAMAVVAAFIPTLGVHAAWTAKYLVATWHLDPKTLGAFLWFPPLLFDAGCVGFGALSGLALRGGRDIARPLFALCALLTAGCGLASAFAPGPRSAIAAMALADCGCGGLVALATAELHARLRADRVGTAQGIFGAVQSLMLIIALPAVGEIVTRTGGSYRIALIAMAAWVIPGTAWWLSSRDRVRAAG